MAVQMALMITNALFFFSAEHIIWRVFELGVRSLSYAPGPMGHPLYLRGGAVSLLSKAERLVRLPL